jgi:hypothetical protein
VVGSQHQAQIPTPSLLWNSSCLYQSSVLLQTAPRQEASFTSQNSSCHAGTKHWTIYDPQPGVELPNDCSNDLLKSQLSEHVSEVTLRPGDVLYLPRGFAHHAKADNSGPSTHLTVSTYQQWSNYNLLMRLLEVLRAV